MNSNDHILELLLPYIEGELSEEEVRLVESALAKDPALRKELAELGGARSAMLFATAPSAHPQLAQTVLRSAKTAFPRRSPFIRTAAAFAACFVVVLLALLAMPGADNRSPVGTIMVAQLDKKTDPVWSGSELEIEGLKKLDIPQSEQSGKFRGRSKSITDARREPATDIDNAPQDDLESELAELDDVAKENEGSIGATADKMSPEPSEGYTSKDKPGSAAPAEAVAPRPDAESERAVEKKAEDRVARSSAQDGGPSHGTDEAKGGSKSRAGVGSAPLSPSAPAVRNKLATFVVTGGGIAVGGGRGLLVSVPRFGEFAVSPGATLVLLVLDERGNSTTRGVLNNEDPEHRYLLSVVIKGSGAIYIPEGGDPRRLSAGSYEVAPGGMVRAIRPR